MGKNTLKAIEMVISLNKAICEARRTFEERMNPMNRWIKPGRVDQNVMTGQGIWALIDFIFAVAGIMKDKEGKLIKNW